MCQKNNLTCFKRVLLFVLLNITPIIVKAYSLEGTVTLNEGETKTISLGQTYINNLAKSGVSLITLSNWWKSTNTNVAVILSQTKTTCTIKGIKAGTAKIQYDCTFKWDGYYRSFAFEWNITVNPSTVSVTKIELNTTSATMSPGDTKQLTATVYPTNATNRNVVWSTSIYAVASVSNSGLVTANGAGTAVITCRAADGSGTSATCTVKVNEPVVAKPEAYAVYKDSVLTFYYDNAIDSREGKIYKSDNFRTEENNSWGEKRESIKTVVFDDSFSLYDGLTSTAYWFHCCFGLKEFVGLKNLNTTNVTNMSNMFRSCKSLTSLDVNGLNTANVTNMESLFAVCSSLISLDVKGFNTTNVVNMKNMFYDCCELKSLDISGFNTSNVTNKTTMFSECNSLTSIDVRRFDTSKVKFISGMFHYCTNLTNLDVSNFNTSNITNMGSMFKGCYNLINLDISGFNTTNVTKMGNMFQYCNKLKRIQVGNTWSTINVKEGSQMFSDCFSLVGGAGTTYDENHTDYTYAHIDGGPSNPGYLTYKEGMEPTEREAYAVYKDSVLTFYYDNAINSREGDVYKSDKFRGSSNGSWGEKASAIKTVKFENSFSAYGGLTTTATWFRNCRLLTAIDGLENLNTTNVTDMKNMFRDCSSLTNLDLSGLSVVNVTNMQLMFYGCNNLTNLNLSRLNASNVTYMDQMFQGCSSLTNLNLSGFKTSNVTITRYMFSGCSSLTYLDLSGFSTAKVTDMRNMFSACSNLRTIYVSNEWSTSSVNEGYDMFYSCTSLVGGAGTTYNGYNRDYTYAHIDGGPSNPGYLTGVGSEPETQTYEYHIVIWLNDGTKVEYKYDENLVIRCEVGKLSITTKNGIVDYALRNIKEITLSKKTEDGTIIPISPSETENAGIVICKNNGSQIEITADRVKNIKLYMEKTHQGHEYIDLGLDTYWAACNIGADAPEGKGYYFSWGETQPKKTYDENTYKFGYPPAKYNDEDGLTQLLPADDAAHVYWGGQWRLPTRGEENELYNKCEWTWTNVNGVDGFTVTGPNGNSIFLPTTGLYDGDSTSELKRSNTGGWYWSSTTNGSDFACGICFPTPNNLYMNVPNHERWDGHAIRPVVNGADVSESFGIIIYLVDGSEIKIPREELDKITAYFVTSTIQGDVNGDVVVDVADIATIISVMAGDGVGTGHVPTQGDVNGDGVVDVADIATIISIMAGSTSDDDTEPENAIHPELPYDYVKGEIPNISESQLMVTISTNAEALPGGAVIINASANTLIECFYIAISGQPGYYIKYPETPTPNGGNYIYRFPLLFPQDWDHDIVVKVCGLTKDGRFFVCQDLPIRYHEAGTGALQVSLTFDNAKDIDLHLITPGGTHYYYGNKGYSKTYENGEVVYVGLDIDSNPGCNIDNINCENITLPEEAIEEGTYKVFVNMYSNCNTNIATGWTCVATRGGQLISNQLAGYGNPASGVYPVGQRNHDMTEVMRFNVELTSAARAAQRKQYVITPIPLDDAAIMKMEEEKARIGE